MNLTKFEKEVLELAVNTEAPGLFGQLENLRVLNREFTGVGVFIDFDNPEVPSNRAESKTLANDIIGERSDLADVLRFVVEIKYEKIMSLEIYANSGDWFPECLSLIKLSYLKQV
jgi:hypothetical protein